MIETLSYPEQVIRLSGGGTYIRATIRTRTLCPHVCNKALNTIRMPAFYRHLLVNNLLVTHHTLIIVKTHVQIYGSPKRSDITSSETTRTCVVSGMLANSAWHLVIFVCSLVCETIKFVIIQYKMILVDITIVL